MSSAWPTLCRFAPSPNGALHLGHAYSALCNHELATRTGGRMLLRMEDIDLARCSPANEAAIREDLAWLGVGWDGPVRRQSEHLGLYADALDRLAAERLVYPCFCTRGEIARALAGRPDWPRDPDGAPLYPGTCRQLGPAEIERRKTEVRPFGLRLDMGKALALAPPGLGWTEYRETAKPVWTAATPQLWGDAVLRRKDVPTSYHVAVVIDDALQGITDVVRGEDLLAATHLHRLLQAILALPAPAYRHHRLILDRDGRKLSKSRNSPPLAALRRAGATPRDIRAMLGLT